MKDKSRMSTMAAEEAGWDSSRGWCDQADLDACDQQQVSTVP